MRFTIVMTVYKRPELTLRALHSVLQQNHPDWELRMYADGPHPEVKDAVEILLLRWPALREKIYYSEVETTPGTYGNPLRRLGLTEATGEYICFVGHDCLIDAGYLSQHLNNIRKAGGPCVSSVGIWFWSDKEWAYPAERQRPEKPLETFVGSLPMLRGDEVGHTDLLCNAFHAETARRVRIFREEWDVVYGADFYSYNAFRDVLPVSASPLPKGAHF